VSKYTLKDAKPYKETAIVEKKKFYTIRRCYV